MREAACEMQEREHLGLHSTMSSCVMFSIITYPLSARTVWTCEVIVAQALLSVM